MSYIIAKCAEAILEKKIAEHKTKQGWYWLPDFEQRIVLMEKCKIEARVCIAAYVEEVLPEIEAALGLGNERLINREKAMRIIRQHLKGESA